VPLAQAIPCLVCDNVASFASSSRPRDHDEFLPLDDGGDRSADIFLDRRVLGFEIEQRDVHSEILSVPQVDPSGSGKFRATSPPASSSATRIGRRAGRIMQPLTRLELRRTIPEGQPDATPISFCVLGTTFRTLSPPEREIEPDAALADPPDSASGHSDHQRVRQDVASDQPPRR